MLRLIHVLYGCFAMAIVVGSAAGDTIEDIEKSLDERRKELKTFSAKTHSIQDMDLGGGNAIKSESDGTYEWMHKDGKFLFRMEQTGTSAQTFGGQESKSKSISTTISDGEYLYTTTNQDGQKSAFKTKFDPQAAGNVKAIFSALRENHTLRVQPDETLNGRECYVVEATAAGADDAQDPSSPGMVKLVHHLDKKTGMPIKTVGYDKAGKVMYATEMTDIKENVDLNPERFVFKAPPGVEVTDLTS